LYFGDKSSGFCQCCKYEPIQITNFDAGHIQSEKRGGTNTLNNLKPVCRTCNTSMGTQNMNEFIVEYGFDKL
jgi:hypothetical protein